MKNLRSIVLGVMSMCGAECLAQPNWQGVPYYTGYGATTYGPRGPVYDLKSWDPDGAGSAPAVLVIAGGFQDVDRADGTTFRANNICIWDGCDYQPLCDTSQSMTDRGFNALVRCLEVYQGVLYAGGVFGSVDGAAADGIASWNGTNWSEVGGGVQDGNGDRGWVYDLHTHNDGSSTYLYVGGVFEQVNGGAQSGLARWNGSAWSSIGNVNQCANGTPGLGKVMSIASEGTDLVIAGDFWSIGGTVAADTAWYSGGTWSRTSSVYGIGENITIPPCTPNCGNVARSTVHAVGSDGTYSWAGGLAGSAVGVHKLSYDICSLPMTQTPLTGIARSQRVTWSDAAGAGAGPQMIDSSQFLLIGSDIYAVGDQQSYPPNDPSPTSYPHNVCKWSGSAWVPVGDYLVGAVRAIEVHLGEIYIGGDFGGASTTFGTGATRSLGGPVARLTPQCSPADLGRAGGVEGGDGNMDNNDQIAFYNLFFGGCPAADLGAAGGVPGRDGLFDNNDEIAFWTLYFDGCP